jgi:hypothetical protein
MLGLRSLEADKPFLGLRLHSFSGDCPFETAREENSPCREKRQEERFSCTPAAECRAGNLLLAASLPVKSSFYEKAAASDLRSDWRNRRGKTREIRAGGKPFMTIDGTTLPLQLVESELFGYEKGFHRRCKPQGGKVTAAAGAPLHR